MTETPRMPYLKQLISLDVERDFGEVLRADKWSIDRNSGKYVAPILAVDHSRPWVYVHTDSEMYCGYYHMICNRANIIPARCLKCWKVCVMPRTVHELMQLYALQKEHAKPKKWYCKCGMDLRKYTAHRYGGYFYTVGKSQGEKRWGSVRKLVDEHIGTDVPVILKRYCTEFELALGPTDRYERPEYADAIEAALESAIDYRKAWNAEQPEWLVRSVIRRWLEFAYSIGDMTCLLYNDDQPFYPPLVTYHQNIGKEES